MLMTLVTNAAFLRLSKRAEANTSNLLETFIDVGPLFTMLSGVDHQILFGRRGTGKTHALSYLATDRALHGDAVAAIDLRNIGSNAGMYADPSQPLPQRATGLIIDTLSAIHDELYAYCLSSSRVDLSQAGPALDAIAEAITQVRVVGEVERSATTGRSQEVQKATEATASVQPSSFQAAYEMRTSTNTTASDSESTRRTGQERLYVNFGSVGAAFKRVLEVMNGRRLWILLDEWSSIPIALQPYLADLLRRSLFPVSGMSVKIAAIEHRSRFQLRLDTGDYLGIELGADASANVSLDDFMVFDNDEEQATVFWSTLIVRHATAVAREYELPGSMPVNGNELIERAFADKSAFAELVRASEGVPRDAINILSLAAQRALNDRISAQHIRSAAKTWYQRDKDACVGANPLASSLLHWIIDEVINRRRARAFLLDSDSTDAVVGALYDARVIHVLKRGISSPDSPGLRYDVYKLDYGCYVDLVNTAKAPLGLLPIDGDGVHSGGYVNAPPDDCRSVRRAVLSLQDYYRAE